MLLIDKNATKRHKPLITADSERPAYFVHPHITADQDPLKGRLLRASAPVPAGTILLVDTAYAIVPVNSAGDETTICSNLACSRRVPQNGTALRCPRGCIRDVIWCNTACRATDIKRHQYECLWLKRNGDAIQSQERQYDFATLWHVVRLLASWNLDLQGRPSKSRPSLSDRRFEEGWEAVESCCDYLDSWPESQVKHWTRLINMYLSPISGLPYLPAPDKLLSLICKEETNTFGLYPKVTGPLYAVDPSVSRGECYGYGLYPRAARFNHSCLPNVTHQPDSSNRMVYTAARDILKGEECMITYFDLTVHKSVSSRQELVQELFRFRCTCEQCLAEEGEENCNNLEVLPFSSW